MFGVLSIEILRKKNVELAHKHGLAVAAWTVNREKDIVRMID